MSWFQTLEGLRNKWGRECLVRQADGDRIYDLYLLCNKLNGKIYVGKTSTGTKKRLGQHISLAKNGRGYRLHAALRKYGVDNFGLMFLASTTREAQINEWEKLCIDIFNSHDRELGYNSTLGGDGVNPTEETKEKIRRKATGRKLDEATKHKIRLCQLGRKKPLEVRQKLSQIFKGRPHPEQTESMRLVWQRPGFREHMSEKMKQAWIKRRERKNNGIQRSGNPFRTSVRKRDCPSSRGS